MTGVFKNKSKQLIENSRLEYLDDLRRHAVQVRVYMERMIFRKLSDV